jgi:hypothetical protein
MTISRPQAIDSQLDREQRGDGAAERHRRTDGLHLIRGNCPDNPRFTAL